MKFELGSWTRNGGHPLLSPPQKPARNSAVLVSTRQGQFSICYEYNHTQRYRLKPVLQGKVPCAVQQASSSVVILVIQWYGRPQTLHLIVGGQSSRIPDHTAEIIRDLAIYTARRAVTGWYPFSDTFSVLLGNQQAVSSGPLSGVQSLSTIFVLKLQTR